jgi:hypothetical protein
LEEVNNEVKLSKRAVILLFASAAVVSLVGATAYTWFFRLTAPVVYGESLGFWYSDETLNGGWLKIEPSQTASRPAVDLTKGFFDVKLLANNSSTRPAGVKLEIEAIDTATGGTTSFIGFNLTGGDFGWGAITWEQELSAASVTTWNIRYVLSSDAPLGYTAFSIDWTVSRFETVVQEKQEFTTVDQGYHSGITSSANYAIYDNETWTSIWNQHMQFMIDPPLPPSVDFSKYTIIAVFMGEVSTGGYAINVYDVVDTGSSTLIKVEKTQPGPRTIVTQALTQPYHIIQIAKTNKLVFFDIVTKTIESP